jgi:hypothetical protein
VQFSYAGTFRDKIAVVKTRKDSATHGKSGAIDPTGKFAIPAIYDRLEEFKSGAAIACNYAAKEHEPNKCGLIDKTGKMLIPLVYHELTRDDAPNHKMDKWIIAKVILGQRNSPYGPIDNKKQCLFSDRGKVILPCKYDFISQESANEFKAVVNTDDFQSTYYYFDGKGKLLRKQ